MTRFPIEMWSIVSHRSEEKSRYSFSQTGKMWENKIDVKSDFLFRQQSRRKKVLQRAVSMLLEPIYEQDFLGCSFGFRPGRSPHRALDKL